MRFGAFEISEAERVVRVNGQPVALGARGFDLLVALAHRRDRLVTRQELLELVWPGVVVEEHNITAQISTLRKLLGPQAIATIPGRGYRFTAPVGDTPVDAAPAAGPPLVAPSRLPRELTAMVGRDLDRIAVSDLLQRHRLVTVVGAGGMGKSLLAKHVLTAMGGSWPHGVCWVELASIGDPEALPVRIGEALGVHPGAGSPVEALCASVSSLSMVLALDNAEHLTASVARTASALLEAAPDLRLLVTSQAPLRLPAERVYRLGPLAVPEGPLPAGLASTFGAVALFVERARGADARFVLSDTSAPAAIELCRQLDGLPLAIELAAARAPLLGVTRLAASMQDRLQLLTRSHDADAPPRQQTLRAAVEWSHGLLDDAAGVVFRRLGVVTDSASLAFVQQVVADDPGPLDPWAVLDALGTLVDRSLVAVLSAGEHAEPRYRLLESPRLFAIERLAAAGEADRLRRRHATRLAADFDAAWDERWSGRIGVQAWVSGILLDGGNARDAIAWALGAGEPEMACAIATTLCAAMPRSSYGERASLADLCESLADRVGSPQLRLRALEAATRPMYHSHQQQSLALADRALALARELDRDAPDRWVLYQALSTWVEAAAIVRAPDRDALRDALAELAALEDEGWPPQRLSCGLQAIQQALPALSIGGTERLLVMRRWSAMVEAAGEDPTTAQAALIDAELGCGHVEVAIAQGERLLERLAGTRDAWSRSMVHCNLSLAFLALDDTERARPFVRAVWSEALQWNLHAFGSDYPVLLSALEGRHRTAARLAGYSDAAYAARGVGHHPLEAAARERAHVLARTALGDAAFDRLYAEGLTLRNEQIAALAFDTVDSPP